MNLQNLLNILEIERKLTYNRNNIEMKASYKIGCTGDKFQTVK